MARGRVAELIVGDSEDRPIVALLALVEVDSSSDSTWRSPLLPTDLYAADIVRTVAVAKKSTKVHEWQMNVRLNAGRRNTKLQL
jgi:hypothetical protein